MMVMTAMMTMPCSSAYEILADGGWSSTATNNTTTETIDEDKMEIAIRYAVELH